MVEIMKKPRSFSLPHSKVAIAEAGTDTRYTKGRYFQLHAGGSIDARTAIRLAKWLIKTALWMENKDGQRKANHRRTNRSA